MAGIRLAIFLNVVYTLSLMVIPVTSDAARPLYGAKADEIGLLQLTGAHAGTIVQKRDSQPDEPIKADSLAGVDATPEPVAAETMTIVEDIKVSAPPVTVPATSPPSVESVEMFPERSGTSATVLSALARAFSQEHLISFGGPAFSDPRGGSVFASRLALAASLIVLVAAALGASFARLRGKFGKGKGAKPAAEGEAAQEHHALLASETDNDAPPMGMMRGPQRAPKRGYGANSRL